METDLRRLIAVAAGREPPDLVFTGGRVANVFSGEIIDADVAICGDRIAGIGRYDGPRIRDLGGGIVCPGFIDGHMHLESTMLSPAELARAVIPHGTTAIIADPHELANVMGVRGIRFVLECAAELPLDMYVMLPSCVPATHLETSGSTIDTGELAALRNDPAVLGLGEMMNYPGVCLGDEGVLDKIGLFSPSVIDGHAPLLTGKQLNAYLAAGIHSDHECTDIEEAREKMRLGMHIMIREGTVAKNMEALLPLVTPRTVHHFSLVTDDLHPSDLDAFGHLDHLIGKTLDTGMDLVTAVLMVTYTTARAFGLKGRGAIAPGFRADITVLSPKKTREVEIVVKDGKVIYEEGRVVCPIHAPQVPSDSRFMKVRPWDPDVLAIPWEGRDIRVIDIVPGQLLTREVIVETVPHEGCLMPDVARDLLKIIVVERHHGTGNIGVGMVRGFRLQRGALATSVAHDSHNILCVGANDQDMVAAVKEVEALQGGMVVVAEGRVRASLALPIGGLLAASPLREVAADWRKLRREAKDLGCVLEEPFMALSFLALPVIPELKITDLGLVDVRAFRHVPLFLSQSVGGTVTEGTVPSRGSPDHP